MSRTHVQTSRALYDFRSLSIAAFIIAASFFINAVPALAATAGSQTTWSDSSGGTHVGNWTASSNPDGGRGGGAYKVTADASQEGQPNAGCSGKFCSDASQDGQANAGCNGKLCLTGSADTVTQSARISDLQERIKQLEDMKNRLQALLDSLKNGGTLPIKQVCPLVARPVGAATYAPDISRQCHPAPVVKPIFNHCVNNDPRRCPDAFGGNSSTSPAFPDCVNNDPRRCPDAFGGSTSTPFNHCVNNDPRRCPDAFGGSTSTPFNHCVNNDPRRCPDAFGGNGATSTVKNCVANDPRRCPDAFGGSTSTSAFYGKAASESGHSFQMFSPSNFGGGSSDSFGSTNSSGGKVFGASTDMSAEIADTLGSLKGDLLDISDMLNQ
jgi:hypothetical protein